MFAHERIQFWRSLGGQFARNGMGSDRRLRIFPQHEGKRQGDIQHGLDREAWQAFFLGEFGGIDRIHYGMADVESGAPVILLHPATEGYVPLPCATSTAVEKI